MHKDLNVPFVESVIKNYSESFLNKLEFHPNPLAKKWKRRNIRNLQQMFAF